MPPDEPISPIRRKLELYFAHILIATERRILLVKTARGSSQERGWDLTVMWEVPYHGITEFSTESVCKGEAGTQRVRLLAGDVEFEHVLSSDELSVLGAIVQRRIQADACTPTERPARE